MIIFVSNKSIFNNFIKLGIKTFLKFICSKIEIQTLNLVLDNKPFGEVEELYLEAKNLIYQNLYINKIIIKIYDFNIKFNYKNHLLYSEDITINSFFTIDNNNLEKIFFSSKFESLRIKIQKVLTEDNKISDIFIKNDLITLIYQINELKNETTILLNLEDNFIILKNIKNKKKILLPVDKNIKFNNCQIKNELINIDLSSKIIFDN